MPTATGSAGVNWSGIIATIQIPRESGVYRRQLDQTPDRSAAVPAMIRPTAVSSVPMPKHDSTATAIGSSRAASYPTSESAWATK